MPNTAIDTNAYRALQDGNRKVNSSIRQALVVGLPVIVLGELYYGAEKGIKKEENLSKLSSFMKSETLNILHITTETARIFGEISAELAAVGRPMQQNDIWIAALCKQYGYALITGDGGFTNIKGLDTISF